MNDIQGINGIFKMLGSNRLVQPGETKEGIVEEIIRLIPSYVDRIVADALEKELARIKDEK